MLPKKTRRVAVLAVGICLTIIIVGGVFAPRIHMTQNLNDDVANAIEIGLGSHQHALNLVADLAAGLEAVGLASAIVLLCLATRGLSWAVLALVSVPLAIGLTEYALKPLFGATSDYTGFPSGHTTTSFGIATVVVVMMLTPAGKCAMAWRNSV